jgi:hypothetical protein
MADEPALKASLRNLLQTILIIIFSPIFFTLIYIPIYLIFNTDITNIILPYSNYFPSTILSSSGFYYSFIVPTNALFISFIFMLIFILICKKSPDDFGNYYRSTKYIRFKLLIKIILSHLLVLFVILHLNQFNQIYISKNFLIMMILSLVTADFIIRFLTKGYSTLFNFILGIFFQ